VNGADRAAIGLSLEVALVCVVVSLPFGIFFGWLLARHRFPGKLALEVACHLPLVLPPVVTGYLLLLLFGARGPFGPLLDAIGLPLAFSWRGAALASAVVGFPLMVRAVRQAVEAVDERLEGAARGLGAGAAGTFFAVTLPLAWPGVLTGAILAFARSLGEFGATITFVGNIPGETRTVPLAIYSAMQRPDGMAAAAWLAGVSVALSVAALAASEWLARRGRPC
jgi:molybdate transport system permease protein